MLNDKVEGTRTKSSLVVWRRGYTIPPSGFESFFNLNLGAFSYLLSHVVSLPETCMGKQ